MVDWGELHRARVVYLNSMSIVLKMEGILRGIFSKVKRYSFHSPEYVKLLFFLQLSKVQSHFTVRVWEATPTSKIMKTPYYVNYTLNLVAPRTILLSLPGPVFFLHL